MRVAAASLMLALASCVDPTAPDSAPPENSYDGVSLLADVAPDPGLETIRATVAEVTVSDASGALVASLPGFAPEGSADEVLGIHVFSQAYVGAPLIAVTTTVGGHRETATYTALYRVHDRQLDSVFTGVIETTEDETTATGSLLVLPGMLLYRAPRSELATLLSFDETARRYVAR